MASKPTIDLAVRTQKPRDYTVQIRHAQSGAVVGTGVVVSSEKIATCAHVVVAAGVNPRKDKPIPTPWAKFLETIFERKPDILSDQVGIYFPQALGGETKEFRAQVAAYFPQYEDDIVLLQLVSGFAPLGPEQFGKLGTAEKSEGNPFRSYGYTRLGKHEAVFAQGIIMGCPECEDPVLHAGPVQLDSPHIAPGMSGAGVLDTVRNRIVGIVCETWYPNESTKFRDTAWAVNSRVLTFPPFAVEVSDEPYPKNDAPHPKTDAAEAIRNVAPIDRFAWNSAPAVLAEWTGRDDLLEKITQDWLDPNKHVTGLIGFGGEGKSSLARKWVQNVIASAEGAKQSPTRDVEIASSQNPLLAMTKEPDGIFWWGFYENRSVDEFLEAALKWMSGGRIDPRAVPSSSVRAQIIGAMLGAGRYLFVLDGLEVLQHQEGDRFGLLQSNDLRDLLTYFARPDNQSFLLVTSRAPLLDLMEYTTYTHRDVDRLSAADGRALLRKLGVQGKDDALDKLVADWDGHALTLSLLSAILTERYGGDVAHIADLPAPTMNEPRYERVHRVLRRYDEHITDAEREFLKLFSAFRIPVREDALEKVFVPLLKNITTEDTESTEKNKNKSSATSALSAVKSLVERLVTYRILRFDAHGHAYTTHPIIHEFYQDLLQGNSIHEKTVHRCIRGYYLSIAGDISQYPTLKMLSPLIEAVHHSCRADNYQEAYVIYQERIDQGHRWVLATQLSAMETQLALLREFFSDADISGELKIADSNAQRLILNEVGYALMYLGHLNEAELFFHRSIRLGVEIQEWLTTSITYRNLTDLYLYQGLIDKGIRAAKEATDLAQRADSQGETCRSLSRYAYALHLHGDLKLASESFGQAEQLEKEVLPGKQYLYGIRGVDHAEHLRRTNQLDYALKVVHSNIEISKSKRWELHVCLSLRILADIYAENQEYNLASDTFAEALAIGRRMSFRSALIDVLLGHGRFIAIHEKNFKNACAELNEALSYAINGSYGVLEADVRTALAWAHFVNNDKQSVKAEAERALRMSEEMGYYWGKVDAEEVLKEIRQQTTDNRP